MANDNFISLDGEDKPWFVVFESPPISGVLNASCASFLSLTSVITSGDFMCSFYGM